LLGLDTDPDRPDSDRHALDADPDPDPTKMMLIRPESNPDQQDCYMYKLMKNHSHCFLLIVAIGAGFWWLAET
jgi:hypothetical protein